MVFPIAPYIGPTWQSRSLSWLAKINSSPILIILSSYLKPLLEVVMVADNAHSPILTYETHFTSPLLSSPLIEYHSRCPMCCPPETRKVSFPCYSGRKAAFRLSMLVSDVRDTRSAVLCALSPSLESLCPARCAEPLALLSGVNSSCIAPAIR